MKICKGYWVLNYQMIFMDLISTIWIHTNKFQKVSILGFSGVIASIQSEGKAAVGRAGHLELQKLSLIDIALLHKGESMKCFHLSTWYLALMGVMVWKFLLLGCSSNRQVYHQNNANLMCLIMGLYHNVHLNVLMGKEWECLNANNAQLEWHMDQDRLSNL